MPTRRCISPSATAAAAIVRQRSRVRSDPCLRGPSSHRRSHGRTMAAIDDVSDDELAARIDEAIEAQAFSGVVRVDRGGRIAYERAAGFADRRWSVPMTTTTR